ncbi:flagellar protein FlaG [Marinimicrobium sp. ABcell2]|uniref:flagellar protein FlaG n=1 Tax=Marinimicrobium sp. ABcell2 TaxID=3069751 RepID=UPI0027B00BD4|nr:flagellar protein FlaG [Marinimicrobium sp. ABcell2]MDQ2077347.1 flagellar protein FlaG [Marinimicrobium sp. ABcell2]
MSDVSSISAAINTASTQASPSSAKSGAGASGKSLPPVPAPAKPSTAVQNKEALENIRESLRSAVAQMNEYVQSTQRDLQFSYDEELSSTVVRVLDRQTKEVIRQIPDEIFLKLARNLNVNEPVQLFSSQA